eukprot:CAMPEP_0114538560 /NCGR_PEP_ID=MMETSP0109-20121206/30211_1 /TAXON_ID=29199 /ORGANISM="Chlorarachnion reptans, Strain CCCM449" /LENGTH=1202 /DNA_ID=CAMNT_0001722593 /DNA_START=836 /DNA_END=4445 /DNA_ORIENTATION=+
MTHRIEYRGSIVAKPSACRAGSHAICNEKEGGGGGVMVWPPWARVERDQISSEEEENARVELWSNCLQAYDSIIRECPVQAGPHFPIMVETMLRLISYDPNYQYVEKTGATSMITDGEEDASGWGDDDDGWGEDDEFGGIEDEQGDETDTSWKVRRAAARALSTFVRSSPNALYEKMQEKADGRASAEQTTYLHGVLTILLNQMKERDSGVKIEVLQALIELLRQISSLTSSSSVSSLTDGTIDTSALTTYSLPKTDMNIVVHLPISVHQILAEKVELLVANSHREFAKAANSREIDVCRNIVIVLRELCISIRRTYVPSKIPQEKKDSTSLPSLENHIDVVFTDVLKASEFDDPLLATSALTTLRVLFGLHSPCVILRNGLSTVEAAARAIASSVKHSSPKVRAHALSACASLVPTLEVAIKDKDLDKSREAGAIAGKLFAIVYGQMTREEVDLEVRETAISSMACLLARIGDHPHRVGGPSTQAVLKDIASRMQNEVTRMESLRALTIIVESPLVTTGAILMHLNEGNLRRYLNNANPQLKHQLVSFLIALCRKSSIDVGSKKKPTPHTPNKAKGGSALELKDSKASAIHLLIGLMDEISRHVSEKDLYLARLSLDLLSLILSLANTSPSSNVSIPEESVRRIVTCTVAFIRSPLIQGGALDATVVLYRYLITSGCVVMGEMGNSSDSTSSPKPAMTFVNLCKHLVEVVDQKIPARNFTAVSRCLSSSIIEAANKGDAKFKEQAKAEIRKLVKIVQDGTESASRVRVALLTLSECAHSPRSDINDSIAVIHQVALKGIENEDEEVRSAAAIALGCVAARSSKGKGLLHLLSLAGQRSRQKYLLLSASKQAFSCVLEAQVSPADSVADTTEFDPQEVAKQLRVHIDAKEEGVRSVVAECYGTLFAGYPKETLPGIGDLTGAGSCSREMLLAALRHALLYAVAWRRIGLTGKAHRLSQAIISIVNQESGAIIRLFKDSELPVRLQAMNLLHAVLPHYPNMFSEAAMRDAVLPAVSRAVTPDEKLIRTINFGSFTHRVDDGLPLRRSGFKALGILIATAAAPSAQGTGVSKALSSPIDCLKCLAKGLEDSEADASILAWQVLHDVAKSRGAATLLEIADDLPGRILGTIKSLLRRAKGTDAYAERAREVLRECVRGLYSLTRIQGVERCSDFMQFFERVKQTSLLNRMLKKIVQAEKANGASI